MSLLRSPDFTISFVRVLVQSFNEVSDTSSTVTSALLLILILCLRLHESSSQELDDTLD